MLRGFLVVYFLCGLVVVLLLTYSVYKARGRIHRMQEAQMQQKEAPR